MDPSPSYTYDSPASPSMAAEPSASSAPVIPCHIISDTDEDRAEALLNSLSHDIVSTNSGTADDPIEIADNEYNRQPEQVVESDTPSVKVLFMNTDIGRKYRHEIEKFFHTIMTAENLVRKPEPLPTIQSRPNLKLHDDEEINALTVVGAIEVCRYCMIDRQGWPMIANMLNQTPGIDIPQYTQQYKSEPYPPPDDAVMVENKPIKTSKKCFNCGGDDHEARKCPKPFDKRTFQKNKTKFLASGLQYGRYHKDDEKNSKLKPGVLSTDLRVALGLRDDELPRHIYKMRQLGYPPGWLLEAEATNSGLAMFDKHGREVDLDGDLMEDGQVPEHRMRDENNLKYNADKLIAYPGFNVPCPEGVIDEALDRRNRLPKMRAEFSLSVMSSQYNIIEEEIQGSKKRTRYDSSSSSVGGKRRKTSHNVDMELSDDDDDGEERVIHVEDNSPPLPPEDHYEVVDELPPEPEGNSDSQDGDDEGTDDSSTPMQDINVTLNALEEEKRKLLAELNDLEHGKVAASTPSQIKPSSYMSEHVEEGDFQRPTIRLEYDEEAEYKETPPSADTTSSSYQSLSHQIRTPIISHSSINCLPSYDKFSEGITEHLPYENLPNATGTFEKMSGLLKSVKDKMLQLRPRRKKL